MGLEYTFFCGSEPSQFNACVGNNGNPSYSEYAEGFAEAAIHLIDTAIDRLDLDTLIYPICFNMRHAVELKLKQLVLMLGYVRRDITLTEFEHVSTHDISKIWICLESRANQVDKRVVPYLDTLKAIIVEFADVDPTGQTFRYPFNKSNKKHLTEVSVINVFNLKKVFEKTQAALQCIYYFIENLSDEYRTGTYTRASSRYQIEQIAKKLPQHYEWANNIQHCDSVKESILREFDIGSNEFGRIKKIVENHYDFAAHIGKEILLKRSTKNDWINVFQISKKLREVDAEFMEEMLAAIQATDSCVELISPEALLDIFSVYDLGRSGRFSEDYESIFNSEISMAKIYANSKTEFSEFSRYFITKTNLIERSVRGLTILKQKTILQELKNKGFYS